MKERLTDKQVLDKIETYIRLTKLPDSSRYDMATSELFALMHMEQKTDPILWAYSLGLARGYRMHAARSKA